MGVGGDGEGGLRSGLVSVEDSREGLQSGGVSVRNHVLYGEDTRTAAVDIDVTRYHGGFF